LEPASHVAMSLAGWLITRVSTSAAGTNDTSGFSSSLRASWNTTVPGLTRCTNGTCAKPSNPRA
jgi:hypothetical protein